MRRFTAADGRPWDVVLGRESWGTVVALFVPSGSGEIRQARLSASGYDTAQQELDTLTEAQLRELLEASQPKSD